RTPLGMTTRRVRYFKKTDLREALGESALRIAKCFAIAVVDGIFVWPGWGAPANCSGIQHHSGEHPSGRPDLPRVGCSAGTTLVTARRRGCDPMDCLRICQSETEARVQWELSPTCTADRVPQ